jgi:hypothetical protein
MGFSAYILESLKRYGKAEIGRYGVFILDYQPAHWNIAYQNFAPPKAKLTWMPANNNSTNLDLLVSSVSRLHELPRNQSSEFIRQTFIQLDEEFTNLKRIDLGVLGQLTTEDGEGIRYIPGQDLNSYFEYTGLNIKPLPPQVTNQPNSEWLIWIVIAALTFTFLWIIFGIVQPKVTASASFEPAFQENQAMKGVNLAPAYTDTLMRDDTGHAVLEPAIIITGTFCKPENILRMKEKIEYLQYQVYEEFIDDSCVRLGIFLLPGDNLETSLADIRKYIEPRAWVLE